MLLNVFEVGPPRFELGTFRSPSFLSSFLSLTFLFCRKERPYQSNALDHAELRARLNFDSIITKHLTIKL